MKILLASILSLASLTAHAETFFCREPSTDTAIAQNRDEYAFRIVEKSEARHPNGPYYYVKKVAVTLLKRDPQKRGQFGLFKAFEATAKSEDVQYFVDARRTHGVFINIYLDELDQTSLTIKGFANKVQMTCTGSDHG